MWKTDQYSNLTGCICTASGGVGVRPLSYVHYLCTTSQQYQLVTFLSGVMLNWPKTTLPVFSCQQTYKRAAHDLHMTHKIGLVEALCGFQFTLKHLDGRQIVVKYAAGKVIEPGKNLISVLVLHVEDDTTACEYKSVQYVKAMFLLQARSELFEGRGCHSTVIHLKKGTCILNLMCSSQTTTGSAPINSM